jgi:hypothetical protein
MALFLSGEGPTRVHKGVPRGPVVFLKIGTPGTPPELSALVDAREICLAKCSAERRVCLVESGPLPGRRNRTAVDFDGVNLGFGRIVSEIEAPNMLVNLV